jgi:hypothetical protein
MTDYQYALRNVAEEMIFFRKGCLQKQTSSKLSNFSSNWQQTIRVAIV